MTPHLRQIVEHIREKDNFLIVSHVWPDGDALGSMLTAKAEELMGMPFFLEAAKLSAGCRTAGNAASEAASGIYPYAGALMEWTGGGKAMLTELDLAWVDLGKCLPEGTDLPDFFANKAGVLLEGGNGLFVGNAAGYVRLNLAMPRSIIETGLTRMVEAIRKEQE